MERTRSLNIKLGLFIISAFMLIVLTVYFIGMKSNLFERNFKSYAIFQNVKGVKTGNSVRLNGINIGIVNRIEIITDSSVRVDFILKEKVREFIREDAVATITSDGLVGNVIVNITPGYSGLPSIQNNHEFRVSQQAEIQDILNELKTTSEYATQMMRHVNNITEKIDNGEGIFGKLFTDTTLYMDVNRIARNINIITGNITVLTKNINDGEGILGRMISDKELSANIISTSNEIKKASNTVNEVLDKLNSGTSSVGKVLMDTNVLGNLAMIIDNTRSITDNIKMISSSINKDDGLLKRISSDKAFADSVEYTINNLNRSAIKLGEASESIENSWLFRSGKKRKDKLNEP